MVSTIGTHIYNPVCRAHNFHIVLYYNYAVATLYEGIYGADKVLYVVQMQSCGGLVKDEESASCAILL